MKVIVFPFDNYVRPLIEYEKLWHFEICGLISPMGFGTVSYTHLTLPTIA